MSGAAYLKTPRGVPLVCLTGTWALARQYVTVVEVRNISACTTSGHYAGATSTRMRQDRAGRAPASTFNTGTERVTIASGKGLWPGVMTDVQ